MPEACEWPGGCANDPHHQVPDGVPVYHLTKIGSDEIDGDYCRIHARLRVRQMGQEMRAASPAGREEGGVMPDPEILPLLEHVCRFCGWSWATLDGLRQHVPITHNMSIDAYDAFDEESVNAINYHFGVSERLREEVAALRAALEIARHWMHLSADLEQFESFEFDRAQVDAALAPASSQGRQPAAGRADADGEAG